MRTVVMETLPNCNICGKVADFDMKTKVGAWAYLCVDCARAYGTEVGTKLMLKSGFKAKRKTIEELAEEALSEDCVQCSKCGSTIEIDCEVCGECGWVNPLAELI